MMSPVTNRKMYMELRNSTRQQQLVAIARSAESSKEQVAEAKRKLVQMNYSCLPNEDGSLKGTARLSQSVGMDIDTEFNPQVAIAKKDELGLLMLERSVSKGYHLVFKRKAELSQEENLKWASEVLGVAFDAAAKDHTRVFFSTTGNEEDLLWLDDEVFEMGSPAIPVAPDRCADLENAEETTRQGQTPRAFSDKQSALPGTDPSVIDSPECSFPEDYEGIAYSVLVEALAEQLGGAPVHGSRNNFIFSMACHLRYVCNDDAEWIGKVLPTYGEEASKVRRTIQSAISRAQSRTMPEIMQRALSVARSRTIVQCSNENANENVNTIYARATPPAMPEKLPPMIELLTSKVEPMYKPAVAMAVWPALGAHIYGCRARYIDNCESDLGGFMSICLAPQSIGKGSINMPIDMIMEDIKERDQYNREQEQEWKQQCKAAKASEKKPARPTDLVIQYIMSNMTNAALVQRLIDANNAGGRFLYTRLDEIELLDQIRQSGGATASEIIRIGFNQALYGAERVGTDSVSGTPPLRFNFNASSTVANGQRYFKGGLLNGTLSRLTFSTIIKPEGYRGIPRFGNYDEEFKKKLHPYIVSLTAATGLVECKEAEKLAFALCEENAEMADVSDDEVFATLSYRANKIAYDKALVLYLAHGKRWTKEMADFIRWSEQYDLWCKMQFFGDAMRQAEQAQVKVSLPGTQNMLEILADRFTREDVAAIRKSQNKQENPSHSLAVWVSRGYIVKDETTGEYIKTEAYKSRRGRLA